MPLGGNYTNLFYDHENSMKIFQNNYNSNIFYTDNLFHSNNMNSLFVKNNNFEDSLLKKNNKNQNSITLNTKDQLSNLVNSRSNIIPFNYTNLTEKDKNIKSQNYEKFSIPDINKPQNLPVKNMEKEIYKNNSEEKQEILLNNDNNLNKDDLQLTKKKLKEKKRINLQKMAVKLKNQ